MKTKVAKKVIAPKAKITFKRNFLPPLLGFVMALSIFGLLNAQWVAAQYEYRFVKPPIYQTATAYTPDPKAQPALLIPSLNIKAPVIFGVTGYDNESVQKALQNGVIHYGQTANPGQNGNVVIVGHSSGTPWTAGDYKYIFTLLDKTKIADKIIIDYKGVRYIYEVTATEVIKPTNLSILKQPADQFNLTLVTCSPVGSDKNRLVIHAKQKSPKPQLTNSGQSVNQNLNSPAPPAIILPSNASSSIWDRITQIF